MKATQGILLPPTLPSLINPILTPAISLGRLTKLNLSLLRALWWLSCVLCAVSAARRVICGAAVYRVHAPAPADA